MVTKPTKPSNNIPNSFGGTKENFSASKIENGYEPNVADILGGANLNYMLDTLGKKQVYYDTITDFINNIPIAKTITVDTNNNLVYKDFLGGRNFGELVYSAIPLTDNGLKLLDGSLIQGDGIYANFVTYMASLVSTYPSIFVTEAVWQQNVATYGVCGKFVYDSTNNTVRLPKITGIIEGTVDVNALGDIVEGGIPQHSHSGSMTSAGGHNHNRGDMDIWGVLGGICPNGAYTDGSFYNLRDTQVQGHGTSPVPNQIVDFLASRTWSGRTSWEGDHTHTIGISNANNGIYKTSISKVQPQTIKMYVYIVVANGVTKTDIQLDIDEVVSDLNYKADIDLSNATSNISSSAKEYFTSLSLPSNRYVDLPIGISDTLYTAPANGYFTYMTSTSSGNDCWIYLTNVDNNIASFSETTSPYVVARGFVPVLKGQRVSLGYYGNAVMQSLRFVYAQGSESEE